MLNGSEGTDVDTVEILEEVWDDESRAEAVSNNIAVVESNSGDVAEMVDAR